MKPFMKALVQALFLANLALTLTLLGGHLRSSYASADSQDPTPIEAGTSQKLPTITVAEAARHLDAKDAIFVDARHPDSFKEGHIPTAVSVPAGEEVSAGTIQRLRSPKLLIAYCDGPTCGAAEEVAQELWVKGLTNVTVMTDGWPAWTAAGLPVLEGSEEATADPPTPRPSPEAPTASLVEFAPPVLNLGQARPGQILKGQVEYKNVSRRPLHIARSETSCGCTEGLYSKPSLQPGESGVLTVGFKSKGRQGAARETVRLYIDGAEEPVRLDVEAEVLAAYTFEPAIVFPTVGTQTMVTMTSTTPGQPFKVTEFKSPLKELELKVLSYPAPGVADLEVIARSPVPTPVAPSEAWSVAIKTDAPDMPPGTLFVAPIESK